MAGVFIARRRLIAAASPGSKAGPRREPTRAVLSILAIISPLFALLALGYAAARSGLAPPAGLATMGNFVVYCALPALMFRALALRPLRETVRADLLLVYAAGSVLMWLLGVLQFARPPRGSLRDGAIAGLGMAMSNSAFIGYPLMQQLIGSDAAIMLAASQIVENVLMYPLGIGLAELGGSVSRQALMVARDIGLRLARNPFIIAIALGLTAGLLKLSLPGPLVRLLDLLAGAAPVCALFVIGGRLAGAQLSGQRWEVIRIAGCKLLLHPLVLGGVVLLWGGALPPDLRLAAVVSAALPTFSIYGIFAQHYGRGEVSAGVVTAATMASFLTLPLWILIARRLTGVH